MALVEALQLGCLNLAAWRQSRSDAKAAQVRQQSPESGNTAIQVHLCGIIRLLCLWQRHTLQQQQQFKVKNGSGTAEATSNPLQAVKPAAPKVQDTNE